MDVAPSSNAVTVGWTWTSTLMGIANILLGGVLVALIRSRPALKKLANEREANLLSERAEEMEQMRQRIAVLEAERALDRHRLNNFDQCFNALFMIFETSPEKAAEAITAVKEMRQRQLEAEALEKGQIQAAKIKRAHGEDA